MRKTFKKRAFPLQNKKWSHISTLEIGSPQFISFLLPEIMALVFPFPAYEEVGPVLKGRDGGGDCQNGIKD